MRLKRIHVNQQEIRRNKKYNENSPVLSCKTSKSNDYGHLILILDENDKEIAKIVYSPDKPLSCGARCWIETRKKIEVIELDKNRSVTNTVHID